MCYVDAYEKEHVPMLSDAISGGGIPIPSTSSKKSLHSLGIRINFIGNRVQCFDDNNQNMITIYKSKMSELLQTIPKSLPTKKCDDFEESIQTTTRVVGGEWFTNKTDKKSTPINGRWFIKNDKIKEDKIK